MKLGNFLTLDPRYNGRGLKSISKNDKRIWDEFYNDQKKLEILVNTIKSHSFNNIQKDYEEVINLDEEFAEGKILYKVHKIRERNKSLINKKKKETLKKTSKLECEVCGFDFYKTYGEIGKEYIECHHNKPISTLQPDEKTKLSDLSLLCSNCHRMLHRTKPWLSIDKLKQKINI